MGAEVPSPTDGVLPSQLFVVGMTATEKGIVRRFLPETDLVSVASARGVPRGSTLLRWCSEEEVRAERLDDGVEGGRVICVSDGLLRSVGPMAEDAPLSVVFDQLGSDSDSTHPSALEVKIATPLSPEEAARAEALCAAWRESRVSRLNHLREFSGALPSNYVLVIDVGFGYCERLRTDVCAEQTLNMVRNALRERPSCALVLLPSGAQSAARLRKAIGEFDNSSRVTVLDQPAHPVRLIECASTVFTYASHIGFEAVIWDKPVRTFGAPFYGGWGFTLDELPAPVNRVPASKLQIVHAALISHPVYIDPETGAHCEVERVVDWMGLQRSMRERFPPVVFAHGFSVWKRPLVQDFFQGSAVEFVRRPQDVPRGETLVVWGSTPVPKGVAVVRLEDGFLRSAGLGAHLVRPLSWVQDTRGIYYDATQLSDLEFLLRNADLDGALLARAEALRHELTRLNLTKYNIGGKPWERPFQAIGKRVILVPGQVESDASLSWGAPDVRTNMELLRRVRQANPDAWLIYKPHPDVVAGMRKVGVSESDALRWCDESLVGASMGQLLDEVDEVHTMTSLAGFEALMRSRKVVCYGNPFYAGWGLTEDLSRFGDNRRTRHLDLRCLVAVVLLKYPTYVSFVTRRFMTAERALLEINMQRNNENIGRLRGVFRYCLRLALRSWSRFLQNK